MSEKGQAWKKRWRRRREQDAQPSTPSVTESAERILAHDGTSTAGDARVCAEFVLAVQERFKERIEDARVVLGQGPDETVRWLSGESRPAKERPWGQATFVDPAVGGNPYPALTESEEDA